MRHPQRHLVCTWHIAAGRPGQPEIAITAQPRAHVKSRMALRRSQPPRVSGSGLPITVEFAPEATFEITIRYAKGTGRTHDPTSRIRLLPPATNGTTPPQS